VAAPRTQAMQAVDAELATYPVLQVVTAVVEVHEAALDGHKTQAEETKEYPVKQEVGTLAEDVQAEAPAAVHWAQTVEDPIKEYPGLQVVAVVPFEQETVLDGHWTQALELK